MKCQQLKTEYEQLKKLKRNFVVAYEKVSLTGNLAKVKEVKRKLEEARNALEQKIGIITGLTPEGKEVKFNLSEQLKYWQNFYQINDVNWVNLPKFISITTKQRKEIKRLIQELGFDKMLIIPENLTNTGEKYEQLHQRMTAGYDKTWLSFEFQEEGKGFFGLENESNHLRIILTKDVEELRDDENFSQTFKKDLEDIERQIFEKKRVKWLDMATYLVWQREYYQKTGRHLDGRSDWVMLSESTSLGIPCIKWEGSQSNNHLQVRFEWDIDSEHRGCRLAGSFDVGGHYF